MPAIASTFPARSGFPLVEHRGHTYLASWTFTEPITISAFYIRPMLPEAYVRLEQVRLLSGAGEVTLLNHMLSLGDQHIAYRSEDVLVYRNDDARPRAYTVPTAAKCRMLRMALQSPGNRLPSARHRYLSMIGTMSGFPPTWRRQVTSSWQTCFTRAGQPLWMASRPRSSRLIRYTGLSPSARANTPSSSATDLTGKPPSQGDRMSLLAQYLDKFERIIDRSAKLPSRHATRLSSWARSWSNYPFAG